MVDFYPKNWKYIKIIKRKTDKNSDKEVYYLAVDDFKFIRNRCNVNSSINWRFKDVCGE